MKKGFTLIELLGVFVIISLVLILSVPAITNMLKQAEQTKINSYKEKVYLATEAYVSKNKNLYLELKQLNKITYVKIESLLFSNYLNSNLINPKTNKKVSEESSDVVIVYMNENKEYIYELLENLSENEISAINAYEELASGNITIEEVNNKISALPSGKIKTALQNKMGA